MDQFYTYLHCRPNGDPFYVGKGRGKRSRSLKCGRNSHHIKVVAKYGSNNIGIYLFPCESEAQAIRDEIQQIAQLRRDGYVLANATNGGEGVSGLRHSPQSRAKMAAAKNGRKLSEETRQRMSAAHCGRQYTLGKTHSAETRQRMSETRRGRPGQSASLEARANMSAAHVGQTPWNKGKPSPFRGIPRSAETRAKISAAQIGKVLSEEHRKKLSIARIGKTPWNKKS